MDGKYLITIQGTHRSVHDPDDDDEFEELTTTADYADRSDRKLIKYIEYTNDDDHSAIPITNIIKIEKDRVTLVKRFDGNSGQMIFENGVRHHCVYVHEFGPISISIYTSSLAEDISENGGTLDLTYTMDFHGGFETEHKIRITLKKLEE